MTTNTIPDISLNINPVNSGFTSTSVDVAYSESTSNQLPFATYFSNSDTTNCDYDTITLLENCGDIGTATDISFTDLQDTYITLNTLSSMKTGGEILSVVDDAQEEYTKSNLCIQVTNKDQKIWSNAFEVKLTCPTNIGIKDPTNFQFA